MTKNFWIKSFADGMLEGFGLNFLINIIISKLAQNFSYDSFVIISITTAVILGVVNLLFLIKTTSNSIVLLFSLSSFCCFILSFTLLTIINPILPFHKYCLREINNADGLLMLLIAIIFIAVCFLFKLCVLIIILIRNWRNRKKNTGDGSLC